MGTMVCGMWYVVCGMWYVVYGIWYMVYGIWSWPVMSCNACSFLCSAVLRVLCKNGNFFWMPSIKFVGKYLIWLLKDFNFFFSSSVLNFALLSSITFFS